MHARGNRLRSEAALERRALSSYLLVASFLAVLLSPALALPGEPNGAIARAVSVQGAVESRRAGDATWRPVKLDDAFSPGDTIRVGARGRADLSLLDQSVLRLDEGATVTLEPVKPVRTGVLDLIKGAVHFFSRGRRSLDVNTPFVVAGVRGTEFTVRVEPDRALVSVFEGTVLAENPHGSLTLTAGQSAVAERGAAPVLRTVVRPRDAVRWTLYYPPVLYPRPDEMAAGTWAGPLRRSVEAYRRGDLGAAFDAIATVPADVQDPRLLTYRAQLSLAVGRVAEAAADLDRALALAPADADALSLQAIAAVVQDEKDRALDLAHEAVEVAPKSATPYVALSYAQQARFDLQGARSSLERAVQADPQNALAWARLAEVHSALGDRGEALDAAHRAAALAPDLARTQTVLGFAYLADIKVSRAKAAFEKAIALDSADPLPRLGLGLARIREGDLDRGAREIEIAASLDPSDALVRSYLGKAYYEEKRTGYDEREYAMAKELDPRDPTPWFYDAIAKQTTNRPVEALHDLERAIELNDDRAVYRSRLLLDSDLAARSASLARIYSDLGFQQLALVEGWKSVAADPTSDSAHRLLADSYSALPRHEVARVSELLQAQLLQPLNITPIQPRLAESNLHLISQGGPGALSFNEFNPLFTRDRVALQLDALGAEHSTYGVEPVVAGIYKNLSFSAGYTRFQTDGYRVNDDQKDDIVNAFVQAELTSRTSVQAEYRHREGTHGELQSVFYPDRFQSAIRNGDDRDLYRLGGRHAFSPGAIVIASVMHREDDATLNNPGVLDIAADDSATGGELQFLFRSRLVDLVAGGGYFDVSGKSRTTLQLLQSVAESDTGARHANAYAYAHAHLARRLVVTVGASGDRLRSESPGDVDQVNPKAGITWSPLPGTTLRAAVFRALKRTLIADQTLEPTQVAGFNQFFDENDGTKSWRYGVGLDQKICRELFAGIEGTRRDQTVPFLEFDPTAGLVPREASWSEYQARGHLFWTPHDWLAVRAEYFFERLIRAEENTLGVRAANTHRVPLGVVFSHPSGLGFSATATYYAQSGIFGQSGDPDGFQAGTDHFWIVDAAVTWRLPKRYGFVSVGATNLLDQGFHYFEYTGTTNVNPTVQPVRTVLARVTLAAP
jgi:tetratricopeptide (TPR) repeat protein